MHDFRAPGWLPGGHAQTIWPALFARPHDQRDAARPPPHYTRERWDTPDGDFIDVDFLARPAGAGAPEDDTPLLVLFHGLEGSSRSHYARAFGHWADAHGWRYAVPHFRGCSGELNRAPRAYHSGDFEEVGWILQRLRARSRRPLLAVGVSLGGNALLRWAEEAGASAAACAAAVAAVCAPVDLAASSRAISSGFSRQVYTRMFLRSMKPRALARLQRFPGLFNAKRLRAARDLRDFDDVFTGPLHGFADAQDYWRRASAKPHLARIMVPALLLNPRNDPFVPADSLPLAHQVGRHVTLWQPPHGGHVGFPSGSLPGSLHRLPEGVMGWLQQQR